MIIINKRCSPIPLTRFCLHKNTIIQIHASLVYVICSKFGCIHMGPCGTSIGPFKLSMVLRLKWPPLIKIRHGV